MVVGHRISQVMFGAAHADSPTATPPLIALGARIGRDRGSAESGHAVGARETELNQNPGHSQRRASWRRSKHRRGARSGLSAFSNPCVWDRLWVSSNNSPPLKTAKPDLVDGSRERAACAESVSEVENLSFHGNRYSAQTV